MYINTPKDLGKLIAKGRKKRAGIKVSLLCISAYINLKYLNLKTTLQNLILSLRYRQAL